MLTYRSRQSVWIMLLLLVLNTTLGGCTSQSAQVSQLRIVNSGSYAINNLTVRFPEDRISFGDIPTGETTEYKDVPNGVFRYAAYEYELDGQIITQPVIDWMGENPRSRKLFTYTIDFDPNRTNTIDRVRLNDVKNDD
jgi:hypothetical protein